MENRGPTRDRPWEWHAHGVGTGQPEPSKNPEAAFLISKNE